jgi:transcriptional regulator with XRE-family HTH domain
MEKYHKLKAWRIANNYSQKQMAEILEIAEVTYIRYENFLKKSLNLKLVDKILTITQGDITPNDLMGLSEKTLNNYKKKKDIKIKTKSIKKVFSHHANQKHKDLINEYNLQKQVI